MNLFVCYVLVGILLMAILSFDNESLQDILQDSNSFRRVSDLTSLIIFTVFFWPIAVFLMLWYGISK